MIRKPDAWLHQGEADFDGHKWVERVQVTTSEQVARWIDKNAHPLFRRTPEDRETLLRVAAYVERTSAQCTTPRCKLQVCIDADARRADAAKLRAMAGDGT